MGKYLTYKLNGKDVDSQYYHIVDLELKVILKMKTPMVKHDSKNIYRE
jgi:hypothetical protein